MFMFLLNTHILFVILSGLFAVLDFIMHLTDQKQAGQLVRTALAAFITAATLSAYGAIWYFIFKALPILNAINYLNN